MYLICELRLEEYISFVQYQSRRRGKILRVVKTQQYPTSNPWVELNFYAANATSIEIAIDCCLSNYGN